MLFSFEKLRCCVALLIGCACLALPVFSADYKPPEKAAALEDLKGLVGQAAQSGKHVEIWMEVFGQKQKTELVKSDAKFLTVKVQGNNFDQAWDKIAADQVPAIARACVLEDAQRALKLADYHLATGEALKASEALTLAAQFDSTLGEPLKSRIRYLDSLAPKSAAAAEGEASSDSAAAAPKKMAWGQSIVDKNGKIIREAYLREALDWSTGAINTRLGPDYDFYKHEKADKVPTAYQPPEKIVKGARNGQGMPYTVGTPVDKGGDYSSTHAQLFYSPDKGNDPGVDRISILDEAYSVFNYKPEPTWWGGWHPEPGVKTPAWAQAAGGNIGAPIALARGYNMWCNSAVMIFSSGLVGTAGTCTSQNSYAFFKFPPTKVPTAVTVTPRNEFALITIWDTEKLKGQMAVIALDSVNKESLMGLYSWHEPKPGLPNVGGFRTLKLLGYIDIPGMNAPTAISSYGSAWNEWLHSTEGKNAQPRELKMNEAATRATFADKKSWNFRWISEAGFAVVVSKYEDKIAFIDLQPLHAYMREMYFGTDENFKKTLDFGIEPKQWPYTFELEPKQKPVVISVQATPVTTPTAVICSASRDYHDSGDSPSVVVAFQEGKLGVYKIYKNGAASLDSPIDPGAIACVAAVNVGRNPCCLAYNKDNVKNQFIVVSRGDRQLQWVSVSGNNATVTRTLKDSRLVDPVYCETADTHGTESHVVSVCDFKGRKVVNYRWGPVILHTNGGAKFLPGSDGKDEFECGGEMAFPGFPYRLCGTNVN